MDKYVSQLIEDILAAHNAESDIKEMENIEDHFADVDRYVSGEYDQRIGNVLGFYNEQFPPTEKLNNNQAKAVADAFEDLLSSYHISIDLPDNLPSKLRYQLLISTLDREVYISTYGGVTLEFCHYDPNDCPLGEEFCRCKDIEVEDMNGPKYSEGELPF